MVLKRDSESVKQSNESKDPTGPQVHKTAKSENVDSLVSRFLSELNDLSLEMEESKTSVDDVAGERRSADYSFNARNKARSESNVDLEKISREIEDSLAQLEALRPAFAAPKEEPSQVAVPEAAPETPSLLLEKSIIKDQPVVIPREPKQKVGRPPELFRNSIAAARRPSRLPIAWFVSGAVVLAVLGVAAFYYFGWRGNNHPAAKEVSGAEIKIPAPALKEVGTKVPLEPVQTKKKGSTETAKSPGEESAKSKSPVKNVPRNGEANAEKAKVTPAKSEAKPPVESARQESLPEKPKVTEEVPKSPPAQTVSVPVSPPQQPVPAAVPVAAQPQPKVQAAESAPGTPVVAREASPRETASIAPKPTPPPAEAAAPPSPPVSRTVLPAEPVKKVAPVFPAIARARKVGGKVEVEAEINDNGDVFRAKAVSGPDLLRSAAEEALMKWKFKPASVGGVNVQSKARIIVNFAMQ